MTIEFKAWPKTPRLFREIVITEKMDGSNSAVIIQPYEGGEAKTDECLAIVERGGVNYVIAAQSRNRLITPGKAADNYGFAAFVQHNAEALFDLLGPGRHFGEWWGKGIQKRYQNAPPGMKFFALFNVDKHAGLHAWLPQPNGNQVLVEPVVTLYRGPFSEEAITNQLKILKKQGSLMSPGDTAEGVVVFHTQSRQTYKVTLDNNDKGKWEEV
jgi:hypothetical protein